MRCVALIYNPASGQRSAQRTSVIAEALAVLHRAGVEAKALKTHGPGSAGAQALEAVAQGCDTIVACGGDGTVHEILQSLVGLPVALGVVPMGTANALAANLGLSNGFVSNPVKAVEMLLTAVPLRVPVGRIFYHNAEGVECSRYFTVAAGVGADALFLSQLDAGLKRQFGYLLYLVEGVRVWATHSFPLFEAAFLASDRPPRVEEVSQLLAVRIRDFGGMLRNLAPGAGLRKNTLRLVAFKTRSRLHFLRYVMGVILGSKKLFREIELLDAVSVECCAMNGSSNRVYVEADGELLGSLPARIEIAPQSLTLLIPPHANP